MFCTLVPAGVRRSAAGSACGSTRSSSNPAIAESMLRQSCGRRKQIAPSSICTIGALGKNSRTPSSEKTCGQ
eukprot:268838-Chlamydomonas_euryale.AAC.1